MCLFLSDVLAFEWLCFEERCSRLDAFSSSSTFDSFLTRLNVSCGDISPSGSHFSDDSSEGDIWYKDFGQCKRTPLQLVRPVNKTNLYSSGRCLSGYIRFEPWWQEPLLRFFWKSVLLLGRGTRSFPKLLAACHHSHGLYWLSATIATITHRGHLRHPKQIFNLY